MNTVLVFMNDYAGALTVIFTAAVTIATVVYAILTWALVNETRQLRQAQTEPKLEITVTSFDFAIYIVRLRLRNIGLGPALNVMFKPTTISGGDIAEKLLAEFTEVNFFKVGLAYLGPGEEKESNYTELHKDHEGKTASVFAFGVEYASTTGKVYRESLIVDMSELRGSYQLGKPHMYVIANCLEKLQEDIHNISKGSNKIRADVYTSQDRYNEKESIRARFEKRRLEHESQSKSPAASPSSGEFTSTNPES